jgi:CRP/FNR family cyclic AMP-dependent transcriptional regulator
MVSREEIIHFLKDVSSFKKLDDEQLKTLADQCEVETFNTGEIIFSQGDPGNTLYIVVEGQIAIERELTEDKTNTVAMKAVRPHEYFGEMSLFIEAPRSVTATALKDTVTLSICREDFRDFVYSYPDLLIELIQVLSQRLIEAYDKISEVTLNRKPRELRKLYDKLDF